MARSIRATRSELLITQKGRSDMALPGVSISNAFYPRIQSALEECSANVEVLQVSQEDIQIGLLKAFMCRSQAGDCVLVRVHRISNVRPDGIAAVLQPHGGSLFHVFRQGRYLREIQASLMRHVALPVNEEGQGRPAPPA